MQPNSYYSHYYYWSQVYISIFFYYPEKLKLHRRGTGQKLCLNIYSCKKKDLISLKLCRSQPLGKNLNFQTSVSCCTFGTINQFLSSLCLLHRLIRLKTNYKRRKKCLIKLSTENYHQLLKNNLTLSYSSKFIDKKKLANPKSDNFHSLQIVEMTHETQWQALSNQKY